MIYVSLLIGRPVLDGQGKQIGKLSDIVVDVRGQGNPSVSSIVVRSAKDDGCVGVPDIANVEKGLFHLKTGSEVHSFTRSEGEMLLCEDLFDVEVIDRSAIRVVRVNDVVLDYEDGLMAVLGIDAGPAGLLRRLLPRFLTTKFAGEILDWRHIDPMGNNIPGAKVEFPHRDLGELHASDIAKLIDHLPYRAGSELLGALDETAAAEALEEVESHRQPELLEYLPDDRAVAILDRMAPDAAADLLQSLPTETSDKLIRRLAPDVSANISLLLSYPSNTAGGLMTTDFVIALEDETVQDALSYIREQIRKPDLVYYIYIVDNADDRRLRGVISLRDLIMAQPEDPLRSLMKGATRTVRPDERDKEVSRVMGEYNLLALPVVDDEKGMLGIVTADDVLDMMLPESMRRHLPRLFS